MHDMIDHGNLNNFNLTNTSFTIHVYKWNVVYVRTRMFRITVLEETTYKPAYGKCCFKSRMNTQSFQQITVIYLLC